MPGGVRLDAATDASKLRVSELRQVLHEHHVAVPSGARKAVLVGAFNEHVRPRLRGPKMGAGVAASPDASPGDARSSADGAAPQTVGTPAAGRRVAASPRLSAPVTPPIAFADENVFQGAAHRRSGAPAGTPQAAKNAPSPGARRSPASAQRLAAKAAASPPPARRERLPRLTVPERSELLRRIARDWRHSLVRWAVCLAALLWLWYCHQTRQLGYCPPGSTPPSGSFLERLYPSCTPCPEHAECPGGSQPVCTRQDYVLAYPLQARMPIVQHALPLAWMRPVCQPDTYKLVLASELADAIAAYLAHWHGQVICGYAPPLAGAPTQRELGRIALPASKVKEELGARLSEAIEDPLYDTLWDMALAELQRHTPPAVHTVAGSPLGGTATTGSTAWLAAPRPALTLNCRLRLYVRALVWRSRLRLALALAAAVLVVTAWRRAGAARARYSRASQLVPAALQRLRTQAAQHAQAGDTAPLGVPVAHLRDELLPHDDARTRRQLWALVARRVQQNANVRTRQAQWHGEWQRVWEWMGGPTAEPAGGPCPPVVPSGPTERGRSAPEALQGIGAKRERSDSPAPAEAPGAAARGPEQERARRSGAPDAVQRVFLRRP